MDGRLQCLLVDFIANVCGPSTMVLWTLSYAGFSSGTAKDDLGPTEVHIINCSFLSHAFCDVTLRISILVASRQPLYANISSSFQIENIC
jgi:hypothetical protein